MPVSDAGLSGALDRFVELADSTLDGGSGLVSAMGVRDVNRLAAFLGFPNGGRLFPFGAMMPDSLGLHHCVSLCRRQRLTIVLQDLELRFLCH